jgi:hypothetical protein
MKNHGLPYRDRQYTFPLNRTPLPGDAANADRWHRIGLGYMRSFESMAFPAFRGVTVKASGAQILADGADQPVTVRTVSVVISRDLLGDHLMEWQVREFAHALTDAADYIGQHSADDEIEQPE